MSDSIPTQTNIEQQSGPVIHQDPALASLVTGYQDLTSVVVNQGQSNELPTRIIDYEALVRQHTLNLQNGVPSLALAQSLGDGLDIVSWKEGRFHGERKLLPTPTAEEMKRLIEFTSKLRPSLYMGPGSYRDSEFHPGFLLFQCNMLSELFFDKHSFIPRARLEEFDRRWSDMGDDSSAKEGFLFEQLGMNIGGDWRRVMDNRDSSDNLVNSNKIYITGASDWHHGTITDLLTLDINGSKFEEANFDEVSFCFLA